MNKQQLLEHYRRMSPDELAAELEKQYKKAMKEVHPDLHPEDRERATRLAADLNRRRDEARRS